MRTHPRVWRNLFRLSEACENNYSQVGKLLHNSSSTAVKCGRREVRPIDHTHLQNDIRRGEIGAGLFPRLAEGQQFSGLRAEQNGNLDAEISALEGRVRYGGGGREVSGPRAKRNGWIGGIRVGAKRSRSDDGWIGGILWSAVLLGNDEDEQTELGETKQLVTDFLD